MSSKRIQDIECLRGVAVLMVIVYHMHHALFSWPMPFWDTLSEQYADFWPGVDLFFAISGFVIARTLLPDLAASRLRGRAIFAFWIRRFWRLAPSSWFWIAMLLVLCLTFNRWQGFADFHTNFQSGIAALMSIMNFREASAFQHFGTGPLSIYWSLSLEEQFYLLLPLFALAFRSRLNLVLLLAVILVFWLPYKPWVMMARVHAILLGVLLAQMSGKDLYKALEPKSLGRARWAGPVILLLAVAMIAALAPYGQQITRHPLNAIAVLSAILVFIASFDRNYLFPFAVVRAPMSWVGTRSYALYLVHVLAFAAAREFWLRLHPGVSVLAAKDTLPLVVLSAVLAIGAAELNYRAIEIPLRRRGARIAARLLSPDDASPASTGPRLQVMSA